MLIICNELSSADSNKYLNSDALKSVITENTIDINQKNIPVRTAENVCNLILVSNDFIPIKIEQGDRRYVVTEVSDKTILTILARYWIYWIARISAIICLHSAVNAIFLSSIQGEYQRLRLRKRYLIYLRVHINCSSKSIQMSLLQVGSVLNAILNIEVLHRKMVLLYLAQLYSVRILEI